MTQKRPVLLCILDGWGIEASTPHNAITNANTPHWDAMLARYPHSQLLTSGAAVGLPDGQMGNSEVGHTTIGAGRIVLQNLPRINAAIHQDTLRTRPAIQTQVEALQKSNGTCHLLGLASSGGVHAHIDHIIALAGIMDAAGVKVAVHVITDGRDTALDSAPEFVDALEQALAPLQHAQIATVSGRFFAMDRDNRWERVEQAYDAIARGKGKQATSAATAVAESHAAEVWDEFVEPTVIGGYGGMQEGDALLCANFRADRAREICDALANPDFDAFVRTHPLPLHAVAMVEYSEAHNAFMELLFPAEEITHSLGALVAEAGMTQLRIAETEKYAHVTFFFNGGQEAVFAGESRNLVPSPDVKTYDLLPEMASAEITARLVEAIQSNAYDLIVVNYANTDMVGHTGEYEAAVQAVEAVDNALGALEQAVLAQGGVMLVTADHGNSERMIDPETGAKHTQHTTGPVPAVLVTNQAEDITLQDGNLSDIAPTLLPFLGLEKPAQMTGKNLIT